MVGPDHRDVVDAADVYAELLQTCRAVSARVEARFAENGLTATQFGVLETILHRGPLGQRELGRQVLTSAGNMTDVIDKLEGRGLVRRARQAPDRRNVYVMLTDTGQALIDDLFPRHAKDIAGAMSALSPAELRQLSVLLGRLKHHSEMA